MTTDRKVDLLYKRAKGQNIQCTQEERKELGKYKVECGEESFYTTKSNIKEYVRAVDKEGFKRSFYDWCMDNNKADKRRIGSDEKSMQARQKELGLGVVLFGAITWGLAIYWFCEEEVPVGTCAMGGMVIAYVLSRWKRRWTEITLFVIPILIGILAFMHQG